MIPMLTRIKKILLENSKKQIVTDAKTTIDDTDDDTDGKLKSILGLIKTNNKFRLLN